MEVTNFAKRRALLREKLGDKLGIITAAPLQTRSYDTEFPYRQDSNFKYLTGLDEAEAVLVLAPAHSAIKEVLFVRPKDPIMEVWTGTRMGPDKAREVLEIDHVFSIEELDDRLPDLMMGHANCSLNLRDSGPWVDKVLGHIKALNAKKRVPRAKPQGISDITPLLGELRLVKDQNELQFMKKAQEITNRAHRAAMAYARPGGNESQVMAMLHFHFRHNPAADEAYESIVAGGENACTLHYVKNNQELKDGDLLLIDAGADFHLYASDVTRTFPINGKYTPLQKDVYEIVLAAQKEAIDLSRPGKTQGNLHQACSKVLAQGLIDLGVFSESVESIIDQGLLRKYYPHSTGHWLGLDVHDPCPYFEKNEELISFREGMVFTIEPGLYFPPDDHGLPEKLRGLGIRIEDDILITDKSHENLSAAVPKSITEVEEACKRDWRELLP